MKAPLPPLHDPQQWPLRMTRADVAYVLRISPRTFRERIATGRFPAPEDGRSWSRDLVERYARGGIKEFEKSYARRVGKR